MPARRYASGCMLCGVMPIRRGYVARRAPALIVASAAAGCGHAAAGRSAPLPPAAAVAKPAGSRVITIVMENEEAGAVIGNPRAPYVNRLARRGGLATRSYGVRHPSLPNYLALTSGSTHGIASDCTSCHVAGAGIVAQLAAH